MFKARGLWGRVFLIELGFGSVSSYGGKKTGEHEETSESKTRNNNKLNPHVTLGRKFWGTSAE